jgi:4-hydroxybenzoate polyprenyltransferase
MNGQVDHGGPADAVRGHWAGRIAPAWMRPYLQLARIDRPIGWWLLLWPCWWSAALAAVAAGRPFPDPWHLALFLIGAVAMRGAGCVWNDIVDRDIDARVARTALRPIPSGRVSVMQAAAFMGALCLVGLAVLLQFNWFAVGVGLASLGVVAVYPLAKRVTWWPQLVLGLAFNWGALMGWAAAFGSLSWPPVLLYLAGIAWTIGYDTIYAHQDKEDDALIGVKSTALLFAENTKRWLSLFYGLAVVLFAAAFWTAGGGPVALAGLAAGAAHLAWQVATLETGDPDRCLRLFRANRDFGWILFAGLVAEAAIGAI